MNQLTHSIFVTWRTEEADFVLSRLDFDHRPEGLSSHEIVEMAADTEYDHGLQGQSYDLGSIVLVPYGVTEVIY